MIAASGAIVEVAAYDAVLVQRAVEGDKDAFAALFERHRPLALALCRRALDRPELAADAVQEAALEAFLSLDRLRRPERFGSWLCGIALNVVRRWVRSDGREAIRLGRVVVLEPDGRDPRPTPEERALHQDLAIAVEGALALLPAGQRAAVRLFYFDGLSGEEVAEALCTSPGAVKARLHKARTSLRRQLADHEEVSMAGSTLSGDIPMRVVGVRREVEGRGLLRSHVLVLEDSSGTHRLPIYVGPAEGTAIALELTGTQTPRPMTYLFVQQLIAALGGALTGVRITRLAKQTFYAEATLDGPAGRAVLDARPSDAINLALLADLPINVEGRVVEDCQRAGRHVISEEDYPDGADEIAADTLSLLAAWMSTEPSEDDPRDRPGG